MAHGILTGRGHEQRGRPSHKLLTKLQRPIVIVTFKSCPWCITIVSLRKIFTTQVASKKQGSASVCSCIR